MSKEDAGRVEAAVEAYDRARVAAHGGDYSIQGMSDRNKQSIAPMIAAANALDAPAHAAKGECVMGVVHEAPLGRIAVMIQEIESLTGCVLTEAQVRMVLRKVVKQDEKR